MTFTATARRRLVPVTCSPSIRLQRSSLLRRMLQSQGVPSGVEKKVCLHPSLPFLWSTVTRRNARFTSG